MVIAIIKPININENEKKFKVVMLIDKIIHEELVDTICIDSSCIDVNNCYFSLRIVDAYDLVINPSNNRKELYVYTRCNE